MSHTGGYESVVKPIYSRNYRSWDRDRQLEYVQNNMKKAAERDIIS